MEIVSKFQSLVSRVNNPWPAVLDRVGIRRKPYVLNTDDGLAIEIRPRTGDFFGYYEIVLRGDYFAAGQKLAPGDTVVDVGANIGCFAICAARLVGPTGHVFAIEPEASTFRQLQRNIELNGLKNVTALQMALAGHEGEVALNADANLLFSSIYSTVNGHEPQGSIQRVPVATLDHLLKQQGISHCHYLKLDCEGAEHDISASLSPELAGKVDSITLELHKVPGHDSAILQQRLRDLGYRHVGASTLPCYSRVSAAS